MKGLKVFGIQYGFQMGLSPSMTLMDVNTLVEAEKDRITTLYLTKAYNKVNMRILLEYCKGMLSGEITDMLAVWIQVLTVKIKGDVLGPEARIILGLIQGAPLSLILFLIYINDLNGSFQ